MTRMNDAVVHDLAAAPAAPPVASVDARFKRRRRRRWSASIVLAVVVLIGSAVVAASLGRSTSAPGISVSPTTAPARTAVCIHHPIARGSNYYGAPATGGRSIDFHEPLLQNSVDGDGNSIKADGSSLVKQGHGVTVRLNYPNSAGFVDYLGFGDFDGDGRSDMLVEDSAEEGNAYVIPGTLATGTYDPSVIGLPVPQPDIRESVAVVGDQNGDGADDISVGASLYSGRQVIAHHRPSTVVRPFRTLAAPPRGLVQIDAGAPPSFVVPHLDGDGTAHFGSLDVLDRRSDRLVLDGLTSEEKDLLAGLLGGNYGSATGWLVNGHHLVDFSYSDRDGGIYWRFDLDAPCGR